MKRVRKIRRLLVLMSFLLFGGNAVHGFATTYGSDTGTATFTYLAASSMPTVNSGNPIIEGTSSVIVSGVANSQVVVRVLASDGQTVLNTVTAYFDTSGNYVYTPSIVLLAGETVTAVQTTVGNGASQTASEPVVAKGLVSKGSNPPVINPVKAKDTSVTGTADSAGATITITLPNGIVEQTVADTSADDNGLYDWNLSVPATQMVLTAGQIISATQTNLPTDTTLYTVSDATSLTVLSDSSQETQLATPKFDDVYAGDSQISGSGTAGSTVRVTFANGSTASAVVDSDGSWVVNVPTVVTLSKDDTLTAVSTETGYLDSELATTTVLAKETGIKMLLPFTGGRGKLIVLSSAAALLLLAFVLRVLRLGRKSD
ncbi:Ig-like domain-containing protein [Lactococcus nasutitermitis]|uniref:Ig-like domain-containing protein n=1 Tax=Lactococcus nasutitermitis TaxID=1652957 RepID=A0ABV9JDN7_9LACT|nr:Ig-like domain-containing protein [Lactococcus nasutitermitis]